MSEDIIPTTLIGIKRLAKKASRRDAVSHTVALDHVAQAAGFSNFKHASKVLGSSSVPYNPWPTIIIVGNNDGHEFFKKGLLEKVEKNGEWSVVVGDAALCEKLTWRGERGLSFGKKAELTDPECYAREVWSTQRRVPPFMGFQCPPDHPDVYRALKAAIYSLPKMVVVSFPSNDKGELFEKTARMLRGLNLPHKAVNVILGTDVSKEFWAA